MVRPSKFSLIQSISLQNDEKLFTDSNQFIAEMFNKKVATSKECTIEISTKPLTFIFCSLHFFLNTFNLHRIIILSELVNYLKQYVLRVF